MSFRGEFGRGSTQVGVLGGGGGVQRGQRRRRGGEGCGTVRFEGRQKCVKTGGGVLSSQGGKTVAGGAIKRHLGTVKLLFLWWRGYGRREVAEQVL